MSEAPTPKPPESLEEIRQELTSVPPDALNTDTVQKINVKRHPTLSVCILLIIDVST